MSVFRSELKNKILQQLNNDFQRHENNWFTAHDYYIRENKPKTGFKEKLIHNKMSSYYVPTESADNALFWLLDKADDIAHYDWLYDNLNDQFSKDLLLEVVVLVQKMCRIKVHFFVNLAP